MRIVYVEYCEVPSVNGNDSFSTRGCGDEI